MTCLIEEIPRDIIIYHITNNLELSDIAKIAISCRSTACYVSDTDTNLTKSYDSTISYIGNNGTDVIKEVKNSIFNIREFDDIIDRIKKNNTHKLIINYDKKYIDTSSKGMNSTFKIFQLFQKYAENTNNSMAIKTVSNMLIQYFKILFKKRNNTSVTSENIVTNVILNQIWHNIDINLYYIYENYNFILLSNRSYGLKKYMESYTNIMLNDNLQFSSNTLYFIMIFMRYGNMYRKVYCFYEIIKYLNIFHDKLSTKLKNVCCERIETFTPDINENTKHFPVYFKKNVFVEFDKFTSNK